MSLCDNDFINLKVRSDAAEYLKDWYGDFGWKLVSEKKTRVGKRFRHLGFSRPHYIADKDELQLLQVRLEVALNGIGTIKAQSRRSALALGLWTAALSLLIIAEGVILATLFGGVFPLAAGIVTALLGVGGAAGGGVLCHRVYIGDKIECEKLIEEEIARVEKLRSRAVALRRADDEKVV